MKRRFGAVASAIALAASLVHAVPARADNELASVRSTFYVIAPGGDASIAPIVDDVVTRLQELFDAASPSDPVWVIARSGWAPSDLAQQCLNDPAKDAPVGPKVLGGMILDGTNTFSGGPDTYILWIHGWTKLKTEAQLVSCKPLGFATPTMVWSSNDLHGYGSRNGFPISTLVAGGIFLLAGKGSTASDVALGSGIGNLTSTNAIPAVNEADQVRSAAAKIANDIIRRLSARCGYPDGAVLAACIRLGLASSLPAGTYRSSDGKTTYRLDGSGGYCALAPAQAKAAAGVRTVAPGVDVTAGLHPTAPQCPS